MHSSREAKSPAFTASSTHLLIVLISWRIRLAPFSWIARSFIDQCLVWLVPSVGLSTSPQLLQVEPAFGLGASRLGWAHIVAASYWSGTPPPTRQTAKLKACIDPGSGAPNRSARKLKHRMDSG
jgi:hypothetical protein